jgi:hypothetical protein
MLPGPANADGRAAPCAPIEIHKEQRVLSISLKTSCDAAYQTSGFLSLASNDRALAATNLQLVSLRILEEKRIVAGTVAGAKLGAFKPLPARVADQLCKAVYLLARICPERDARAIGLVILVSFETEKF